MRRAAVIVHPGKQHDLAGFRAAVAAAMTDRGWAEPLWRETSPAEAGERLAAEAVAAGVDLVLACGGDATIAACASGVAGSGVALAMLPSGTGNLLARNLRVPLDIEGALAVALTGAQQQLDVGLVNGHPFVVMAGLGFDAQLLAGTGKGLERRAGWVAYALSALRHLWDRPSRVVLQADDGPWLRRKTARLTRLTGRELIVKTRRPRAWEVDGEVIGLARELRVSLSPGDLLVRVPAADYGRAAG